MTNEYFDFKQFRIYHDRCAQKVGTDGVVLGAWVDVAGARRILDIGTGSGLIALMAAQRVSEAQVVGVDIDREAVEQARQNVAASPFSQRIVIHCADVRNFADDIQNGRFQHVICNPPFYTEGTLPPDTVRALARNAAFLPFRDLICCVTKLLDVGGRFSVILPITCRDSFCAWCESSMLYVERECTLQTVKHKPAKRILITYSMEESEYIRKENIILQEGNERSKEYSSLTRDFYL